MTEQEASEQLKMFIKVYNATICKLKINANKPVDALGKAMEMGVSALEEIQKYRAIGTVEELQKIKEKITPSKSFVKEFLGKKYYQCPVCCWMLTHGEKYCNNCGQALDWGE